MHLSVWLAFVAASAALGAIPGPAVTSVVGYALSSGRRTALASVAGMSVGSLIAMSLSLAGVGAVLRASSMAFMLLKWAGALYLIGMGVITLVRSRGEAAAAPSPPIRPRVAFASNLALGAFHPKTIVFFIAFAPQFISPRGDYLTQAAILVATFCAVVGITDTAYALIASQASALLRKPGALLWSKRAGGGALIAAGVATATVRV